MAESHHSPSLFLLEEKYQKGEKVLTKLEDWKSGDNGWIIDFIAPFGHAKQIIKDLRNNIFKGKQGKALRFNKDNQDFVNKKKDELNKKNIQIKNEFKEKAKLIYHSHVNNNQINNDLVFGQISPNNSQPISGVPQIDKEKPLSLTKRIATENCGNISPTDINQYIN